MYKTRALNQDSVGRFCKQSTPLVVNIERFFLADKVVIFAFKLRFAVYL